MLNVRRKLFDASFPESFDVDAETYSALCGEIVAHQREHNQPLFYKGPEKGQIIIELIPPEPALRPGIMFYNCAIYPREAESEEAA